MEGKEGAYGSKGDEGKAGSLVRTETPSDPPRLLERHNHQVSCILRTSECTIYSGLKRVEKSQIWNSAVIFERAVVSLFISLSLSELIPLPPYLIKSL